VSVEVSPLRVEVTMGSGGTHTQAVRLANQGTEPVRIHARVDDWYLSKDGTPQFKGVDAADPFSAAAWVRLNPPELVVKPGAEGTIRFTTTAPKDTVEGGYRTSIMFEFSPESEDLASRGRQVAFRGRIATLVYVTVGKPVPAVDLIDLQIRTPQGQPAQIVATLKNSGRVQVRIKGTATVSGSTGKIVRQLTLPDVPVLPMSERDVAIPTAGEKQEPLPPGEYRVEVKIDVGLPALLVGETTMKLGA
jgi:P pilus assembly chaperone PapD